MLITVEIPAIIGRVCYLNPSGDMPTVECYSNKTAFRFKHNDLSIGDWVKISGQARIGKTRNKKTGLIDGIRAYYHEPFDGSHKENWSFLELTNPTCILMGPIHLSTALSDAMNRAQCHVENWSKNKNKEDIMSTIVSLQDALDELYAALRQITRDEADKEAKPFKFPEISYDDL